MIAIKYSKISICQPAPLKSKVEQAALRGMTVTSFINGILELAAGQTLNRVRTRELTARDSRKLLAMLTKPDRPNAALRKAARRYKEVTGA